MLISIVLIRLNQRFHPYYMLGKNKQNTNSNEDFTKERKKLETHTVEHTHPLKYTCSLEEKP